MHFALSRPHGGAGPDGLRDSIGLELKLGLMRPPLALVMSGVLWQVYGLASAGIWLAGALIAEFFAYIIARRAIDGPPVWRMGYRGIGIVTSVIWSLFGVLLWMSGSEAGRLAALCNLFGIALYAVMVCHHDWRQLSLLLAPPCLTLLALLIGHADGAGALLTLGPSLGLILALSPTCVTTPTANSPLLRRHCRTNAICWSSASSSARKNSPPPRRVRKRRIRQSPSFWPT